MVPLLGLLDEDARALASDPEKYILKDYDDFSAELESFSPYADPAFEDQGALLDFIKRLYAAGLITFRPGRKNTVTGFFVEKKDGQLRLVVDCRGVNLTCYPPPTVFLSTPSSLA